MINLTKKKIFKYIKYNVDSMIEDIISWDVKKDQIFVLYRTVNLNEKNKHIQLSINIFEDKN